jgi:ankyrin repeat protein
LKNIDALSTGGMTPLHVACGLGYADVAEVLLAAGADPTIRTGNKYV